MSTVPASAPPSRRAWGALLVVLFAAFMDTLDLGITAVAAPAIQRDLHASYSEAQWFLAAYALAFAVLLIAGGRLGDLHGRRRVFLVGVSGFTAASAVCALAPTAGVLIGARFLQGGFGALMIPQVLAVLQVLFPPERRAVAFAVYGSVMNLAQLSGPVLGGLLATDDALGLGWRAIFLVNVPVGVLVLIGTALLLPESRSDRPQRLDTVGVLLVALLSGLLVYPLQQGRTAGWPAWMTAALACALPVGVLVVWHQSRRGPERALVPVGLFRSRSFSAGMVQLLLVYSALVAQQMPVVWLTQAGLGWSALRTGAATVGWTLGLCLLGVPAVSLAPRIGRALLATGCVVAASGTLLLGSVLRAQPLGFWPLCGCLTLIGCGLGLIVPILINLVLAGVPQRDAGGGAGIANAAVYFASAAGVGLVGLLFFGQVAAGGAAHARAQLPALRAGPAAQGSAGAARDSASAALVRCVAERTRATDPYQVPESCRTAPADSPAVAARVQAAWQRSFADAASDSLRYPAGALVVVLALTPLLPRSGGSRSPGRHRRPRGRPELRERRAFTRSSGGLHRSRA